MFKSCAGHKKNQKYATFTLPPADNISGGYSNRRRINVDNNHTLHHYHAFISKGVTVETLAAYLNDVFKDGYMDASEEDVLKQIVENKIDPALDDMNIYIAPDAVNLAQDILKRKVLTTEQFQRFERLSPYFRKQNVQSLDSKPIEVDARINHVEGGENGAIGLSLRITDGGIPLDILVTIPNPEGFYPGGHLAGYRQSLSLFMGKELAGMILGNTITNTKDENTRRMLTPALEGVGRILRKPGRSHGCNPDADHFKMSRELNVIEWEVGGKKDSPTRSIDGLMFKGPIDEELAGTIEQQLQNYPMHVFEPLRQSQWSVNVYYPEQLFPKELKKGRIKFAPVGQLAFVPYFGANNVYFPASRTSPITHELFHALFSPLRWKTESSSYGVGRLYREALDRVKNYDEEAMSTTYQASSPNEYIADGGVVFYDGASCHGFEGSRRELAEEDPLLFLAFVQMDAILKHDYEHQDCENATPPYWAAFTETARAHSEAYMLEYGDAWQDEENLARFRKEALNLDISAEVEFMGSFGRVPEKKRDRVSQLAKELMERCPGWELPMKAFEELNNITLPR